MKRAGVAGVLALGVVLTGCSQSTPPPTQFSTVTVSPGAETPSAASPSASGSGSAGTSSTPDPAKVAEAEQIIRDFEARYFDAQVRGGSAALPTDIAPLVSAPLSVDTQQQLAQQKLDGWRASAEPRPVVTLKGFLPGVSVSGSEFAVGGCVDGTKTAIYEADKKTQMGVAVTFRAYFKTVDGQLKYFDADSDTVSSC